MSVSVFQNTNNWNARYKHECLSQNEDDCASMSHCVHMQHADTLKNMTNSQENDLFTPKPAKLDKHIRIYVHMCVRTYGTPVGDSNLHMQMHIRIRN